MSVVLPVCLPASDVGFGERVRRIVARDRWDLGSPEGVALLQAVLRQTYPLATVVHHDGIRTGSVRRTVVLRVHRDGVVDTALPGVRWVGAVYDRCGAAAYRVAAGILGDGPRAEQVVEDAFLEARRELTDDASIEAGSAAVERAAYRLAEAARDRTAVPADALPTTASTTPLLAGTTLRIGSVRRVLDERAVERLRSAQRAAIELAVLEELKVSAIAERMQTTVSAVNRHLKDGLLAVGSGASPSAASTLARWREAQRAWANLPSSDSARRQRGLEVANAWLDCQVASGAVASDTVILVTDAQRRFVASNAGSGRMLDRPSVVGLTIDDITAEYARPLVGDLWSMFDDHGSMDGEYDCDRPDEVPLRVSFHGVWGRPMPDLQVGYLRPLPPSEAQLSTVA